MNEYIQKENCDASELDGEWVVLNTEKFTITKLNDIGGLCWSLLKEAQTVDKLTQTLMKEFTVNENPVQVRKDLEEFLENLVQCGLITHAD